MSTFQSGMKPLPPPWLRRGPGRIPAAQWMACLGLLAAVCTSTPARAQADAGAALVEQGNYWQTQGRADLAEESWRKLLRVDPQSADAMYGMAQVELSRGNAEPARSWISRLRAAHPNDSRLARLTQQAQQPGQGGTLQRARAAARAGRAAEAVELYRSQFDNRPPPEALALEYYQVLSSTPQGADEGRKGLEQLVKDHPDNASYRLALAQLRIYSEPTRREGIRSLVELARQPTVGAAARASWRQALIWLDARAPDIPLYQDFLASNPNDAAVSARLETLTTGKAAAASSPGVPLGEGFRALDRGDPATAEQRFQQALRTKADDAEALGGLGLVRLRQERFGEAQELLERAARSSGGSKWNSALNSATYWSLVGQARTAREKNDVRGAQALLERAVRIDARESVGQVALADLRAAAGELPQAEQGYKRVLESKPSDTQALRGLIAVYGRQGRADEALALARQLTPEQASQLGGLRDIQVEQARARARQQADAGDAAGAQRTLEDAMLAAPDSPWVRLDLANIYRRQGLMAEARGVMEGLLMSQPDMPDALYASALLASETGDAASGIQYLERIPAASRTRDMAALQRRLWAQSQAQRAQALARQGQVDAARQVLGQAEAALSSDMPAELWGQLAGAYAEIGDAPRALAMSRQLLARSPNPGIGDRLLYASVLLKTRQDIELAAVLRQMQTANMTPAQRSDFDSVRTAFALRQTDALREAGNLEAAYNAMAPVLAERPEDPKAMAALARLYSAARDETQALALYQRVLQRSPTDLDTLLAAAASASALREHSEAENYVMAALKQAPDESRVLAAAGRVYRNAGDSRKAEQYLRAAVEADSRVATGFVPGAAPVGGPAANPFAGMTGGAARAAVPGTYPAAGGNPFAQPRMQPVAYAPGAPSPVYPPSYPVAQAPYPTYPANAAYPVAGAAPNAYPPGALPWASGTAPAAANSKGRRTTTAASNRTATAARNTPQASAYIATPVQQYPVAGMQPVAPVYAQAPQAGGYPPPGYPQSYPYGQAPLPTPGSASAGWNAPLRTAAPADTVAAELRELEAKRSINLTAGTVYRNRAGEAGLSQLSDFQIPIEARFPVGEGKIVVGVTPTVLDAGMPSSDYPTGSRFGGGPGAAITGLQKGTTAGQQNAAGVGLSVGYEGKNFGASIGTTPLGFPETNVIGNVSYAGSFGDSWNAKVDLSRRAVTDSLLSFAGAKDERTNERWGGVVATGVRGDLGYDDGTYGVYGYAALHGITGKNVASNSRFETGGGAYLHLISSPGSKLTLGMNLGLMGYDKNLSYYTFGQGGYFSPQSFVSVAFPVDWSGRSDRLAWRLNASLGVQSFTQKESPYFPTDGRRAGDAGSAAAYAASLGLSSAPFTGMYPKTSKTGLAYNLAAILEYQLAPKMFLGGSIGLNNAQNYRQLTGGLYVRYVFDGGSSLGVPSGTTLRPLVSPYTPLL